MKRLGWVLLVLLLAAVCAAAAADVKIDEKHFPDKVFREEVVRKFDTNRNGVLSDAELKAVKEVRAAERKIYSLKGIEYFTSAVLIHCQYSYLKELDVSKNTELVQLNCFGNSISTLDLSRNRKLENLICGMNAMTELDVSRNKELKLLYCSYSQLKELDVRKNEKLVELKLTKSFYLEKVKIGQKKHMEILWASECMSLKELDISGCPILKELARSSPPQEQTSYHYWGWRAQGGSGQSQTKDLFIDQNTKLITGEEVPVPPPEPGLTTVTEGGLRYGLDLENDTAMVLGAADIYHAEKIVIPPKITIYNHSFTVTAIGANAFASMPKLKEATIGKNVASIGEKAFYKCKKLEALVIRTKRLTAETVGSKAFGKTHEKIRVSVPKEKMTEYKKLLEKRGIPKKAEFR